MPALKPVQVDGSDLVLESHENRIQNLEAVSADTREEVVQCRADIGHVSLEVQRVGDDVKGLGSKMEKLQRTIEKHAEDSGKGMEMVLSRVSVLEGDKRVIKARWRKVRGIAAFPAVAVLSAALAKYGEALYEWIASRF